MELNMEQRLIAANDLREAERFGDSAKAYTECYIDLLDTNDFTGLIHCLDGQSLIYKNLLVRNNSPINHYLVVAFAKEALDLADANQDKIDGRTLSIAYSSYGDAILANGEIQEALPYFEKALAVTTAEVPEKGRLKAHIGGIQYMLGDRSGGISTIENALSEIRSGDMDNATIRTWETGAMNGLAQIYAKEGNQQKALELANDALKISIYHNLPIRKRQLEQTVQQINSGQTDFSL